jgi:hypothetical protein
MNADTKVNRQSMKNLLHATVPGNLADKARAERAREVQMEVASARMQGLEPISKFFTIAEQYIAGEFTLHQFRAAVHELSRRVG